MIIRDRVVPLPFREEIAIIWPGVGNDPALWRLLGHLLLGSFRDEETDRLLISQAMLADLEDQWDKLLLRNYCGGAFLDRFTQTVAPLDYSGWHYDEGKCRMVNRFDVPDTARESLTRLKDNAWKGAPRVYISNGRAASPRNRSKQLETERKAVAALTHRAMGPDAVKLLEYMNGLPPRRYTETVERNIESARRVADALPRETQRQHAHNLLDAIDYAPSARGRTVRLFTANESMLCLSGRVRRALTPDWIEMDLTSSQFAIVAKMWNIPSAQAFLHTNANIWNYLLCSLDLPRSAEAKKTIKSTLYSSIFGMTKRKIIRRMDDGLGVVGIGKRFVQVPIIRDLLDAGKRERAKIEQAGGATNIYGQWLPIKEEPSAWDEDEPFTQKPAPEQWAFSIMACCAQAIEMWLLAPVINAAIENRNRESV